jgi:hypothetical protein
VLNGAQAKVFADKYIAVHLQGVIQGAAKGDPRLKGVSTYSQVSGVSRANPNDQKLADLTQTVFRGEMLRSSLLSAWGWWTFGTILFWIAVAAFVLAGLAGLTGLALATHVLGRLRHHGTPPARRPSPRGCGRHPAGGPRPASRASGPRPAGMDAPAGPRPARSGAIPPAPRAPGAGALRSARGRPRPGRAGPR